MRGARCVCMIDQDSIKVKNIKEDRLNPIFFKVKGFLRPQLNVGPLGRSLTAVVYHSGFPCITI